MEIHYPISPIEIIRNYKFLRSRDRIRALVYILSRLLVYPLKFIIPKHSYFRLIQQISRLTIDYLFLEFKGKKYCFRGYTDDLLLITPYAEMETTAIILKLIKSSKIHPKVFVDVGAHIGKYTILLSEYFEKIIAIEPEKEAYKILKVNVCINKMHKKVKLVNAAVGSKNKKVKLYLAAGTGGSSIIRKSNRFQIVNCYRMDDLIKTLGIDYKNLYMIKIDVEGAELYVIEGMSEILRNSQAILVIEISEENKNKAISYLQKYNYRIYAITDSKDGVKNYIFIKS